jgi:hypothetical protein
MNDVLIAEAGITYNYEVNKKVSFKAYVVL